MLFAFFNGVQMKFRRSEGWSTSQKFVVGPFNIDSLSQIVEACLDAKEDRLVDIDFFRP